MYTLFSFLFLLYIYKLYTNIYKLNWDSDPIRKFTSVRITSVIPTSGLTLLLPLGVALLSDLGLPYARTFEIAHYEGLLVWITPESYNPDILRSHFVRYNIEEINGQSH